MKFEFLMQATDFTDFAESSGWLYLCSCQEIVVWLSRGPRLRVASCVLEQISLMNHHISKMGEIPA
jgi:hypothetical protein